MKTNFVLIILAIILASCKKETGEVMIISAPLSTAPNNLARVKIYDLNSQNSNLNPFINVFQGQTDSKGFCDVGELLPGNYAYYIEIQDNKFTYSDQGTFQLVAGDKKNVCSFPGLNIGSLRIKVINVNTPPIIGINVAIIPHPRYSNVEYIYQEVLNEAYASGITGEDGFVVFEKLPVGIDYSVLCYDNNNTFYYPSSNNGVYIERGNLKTFTIDIND